MHLLTMNFKPSEYKTKGKERQIHYVYLYIVLICSESSYETWRR